MTPPTAPATVRAAPTASANGLQRLLHLVLRIGAGAIAFILMLAALMLGVLLALGVIVWAVVRGRKPAVGVFRTSYRRARQSATPADVNLVVDVEAREVSDTASR